jgi:hypothetical protein
MLVPLVLLLVHPAQACKFAATFSTCNGVRMSNLVFIGTVESMEPPFLSRWDDTTRSALPALNKAYADARESPSDETMNALKSAFLQVHPSLPADEKLRLDSAKSVTDIASLFNFEVSQGLRVRFKVRTLVKHEDDDDDPKDDDEKAFEIMTPFGDCGVDFQVGETYLVYANEDEASGQLITGKCSRTRRLSDAGDDLPYLFFFKDHRKESARLEGFATTDRLNVLDFSELPESVRAPVEGAIIELKSAALTRFTETDAKGKFLFDGLPEADYKIAAYSPGFLLTTEPAAPPVSLHIKENGCAHQLLLFPKKADH